MNNYHTHTTFCDGKNSAEEMVLSAIAHGVKELGFSGHAYNGFGDPWDMTRENVVAYRNEITRLKEKYKDKISILCGIEQDYFSPDSPDGFDFVIGSCHYVKKDGAYIPVDLSRQALVDGVNRYYHGDFLAFCRDYYKLEKGIYRQTKCNIVGHFDLVTKFNEQNDLFDRNDPRYLSYAKEAFDELAKENVLFEINTGAISRGYRSTPYPSEELLPFMKNARFLLSSDSHSQDTVIFGLEEAKAKYSFLHIEKTVV